MALDLDAQDLGAFGDLATALGLLTSEGPNGAWFENPVQGGTTADGHGLAHVMADTAQRDALIRFVDQVLGPPDALTRGTARWVPLFENDDPTVRIYAVVEPVPAAHEVRLGVGVEHTTQSAMPSVSTRLHVPLFRFADRGHSLGTGDAPWLLLGRDGGEISLSVDVTLRSGPPPAGQAGLGAVVASVSVPTHADGDIGFGLVLRDLQLPGATEPRTFDVDAASLDAAGLEELGADVLDLLAGLVRAQADALASDPAFAPFAALAGMLGLRNVPDLPPFPITELPTRGTAAVVDWVQRLVGPMPARTAWLGQLADLLGDDAVAVPDRSAVALTVGPLVLTFGLRVQDGTGGHPVLVPWVEAELRPRPGLPVVARAAVDLLRADTNTGAVVAVPDLRVEAEFGSSTSRLVGATATSDPRVERLRVGLGLDAERQPVFVLTAYDVKLPGAAAQPVVDLSSPDAVLAAGTTLVTSALTNALDALGADAAPLVKRLLGLQPPATVTGIDAAGLLADPFGALRGYWERVVAAPPAMADVLGHLARLLAGESLAALPQSGTRVDPWRFELTDPLFLEAWVGAGTLHVSLVLSADTPVMDGWTASTDLGVALAEVNPSTGRLAFVRGASLGLGLARTDGSPARLAVGDLALTFQRIGAAFAWTPGIGVRPELVADGLAVELPPLHPLQPDLGQVPVPLPRWDPATGRFGFDGPDWAAVEAALSLLIGQLGVAELDAVVALLGWRSPSGAAHLSLEGLLGADPAAAVEEWLADLLLDCDRVRTALGPVAALLSGFTLDAPLGTGNEADPFRCPVGGDRRAPGLRVWLDPGCAVTTGDVSVDLFALVGGEPPEVTQVAATLRQAGARAPDLADLMVGRDSLETGLQQLLDRWTDSDGLVVRPDALPDGVTGHTLTGVDYATLVALGAVGQVVGEALDPAPAAVVHVGTEDTWLRDKPTGTTFDLTATTPPAGRVPDTGGGTWFVRLPTPADAGAARPDLGPVGAQTALLAALLGSRTEPYALVGYGAAGAAVLRHAHTDTDVASVLTVGTPWGALGTDALAHGLGGDALRLLTRLDRPVADPPEEVLVAHEQSPLQRMRSIIDRAVAGTVPGALPDASTEPRRTGLPVHALFGQLEPDEVARGLGAFVADAIEARLAARVAPAPGAATALHVGLDLPVADLDLGGVLVGVGAAVDLCRVGRGTGGTGLEASFVRSVVVDLHLGVHDGWLVGGPGSTSGAGDLRWMSAHVAVPFDGTAGVAELVLHELTGLGVDRERWPVRLDPADATAEAVGPEVLGVLSDVVRRVSAASPDLASLLGLLGLRRDLGLDIAALDRLLLDTAVTVRGRLSAAPGDAAAALRALVPAASGAGSTVTWTAGPVTATLDLATGTVGADVALDLAGYTPLSLALDASAGWAHASLTIGDHDPALGGVRLVAATPAARGQSCTAALELATPTGPPLVARLWPDPDPAELAQVVALQVPALGLEALGQSLLGLVSDTARPVLLDALDVLGLVHDAGDGVRRLRVPTVALLDPAAWIAAVARTAAASPAVAAATLLDAVAGVVAPGRGADPGWPIVDGVAVDYAVVGDRLRLTLAVDVELDLAGTDVVTHVEAGALIGTTGPPVVVVEGSVAVDERGIQVSVDPDLRVSLLRAAPSPPLPLYPAGPGLADVVGAAAESLVPLLLNRLADLSTSGDQLKHDVGELVGELGDALALRQAGQFTAARVAAFAQDPAAALVAALPALAGQAAAVLVRALDPVGSLVAVETGGPPGQVTFLLGTSDSVRLTLVSGATPAVEIGASWDIPDLGTVALETLRISTAGVLVAARLGPFPVQAGPIGVRPVLTVRAGSAATDERLLSLGLALDDDALRTVEVRWTLDARPPTLVGVTRSTAGTVTGLSEPDGPLWLLSLGLGLVGGVVVDALGPGILTAKVQRVLDGVLFAGGTTVDPTLALDLLDAEALLTRLQLLLWNAADEELAVELGGVVTVGLVADGTADDAMLGLNLTLPAGSTFDFDTTDVKISIEVDDSWLLADVTGGLSVFAVHATRTAGVPAFTLEPAVTVAGLGVRFTNPSGPLLDLGGVLSIDGIAFHVYAEAGPTGHGGGAQLELAGFAFAPSAGAGGNMVANNIVNEAGEQASPATRPSFSPAFAVQRRPGDTSTSVTVRAGKPPGPWWLMVQRQLGPLYLERVGFDSREVDGRVTRVSLLFDGRVEIFGLTAAVDQLSLSYTVGGNVFDAGSWSVDLMGLAISADMGGIVLAGGLLKTEVEGQPGYVGMLLGRFGIYGLSVFGGYTSLDGNPSFFVFGAVNGPIGGPPAFFITGLGGGLGINRKLRIPDDPAVFPDYPFIAALDPYADVGQPMQRLRELNEYFPPELGTFWFAGGISFTCFSLVDGIAVLAVSFGNAGLDINLLGLARLALPNPAAPLVSIELGLLVRFSTGEGVFMMRAALTDNSWLLYEDVRLTGGFALALWWKGPLSGQFVLTMGGYHPDFHVEGYPQVPRLGLCWQVSDSIVIKGESFFALTSEALMAGVSVTAIADFGWAWARATFGAQGLVYFDPFWFTAEAWAQVSAGIEIDTWLFGTISISVTVGARVQVQGPEFSGKASVEVGPCTVTIPFGSQRDRRTEKLSWGQFVPKYLEETGPGRARALSGITGHGTLAPATGGSQSTPTPDGSSGRPYDVFAEFEITFTTTVPTGTFEIAGTETTVSVRRSDGAAATLGLKPMQAGALDSRMLLRLSFFDQELEQWVDATADLAELADHVTVTTGSFPMGVWAAPGAADTAVAPALPTGDIVNAGNQVRLEAVAKKLNPGPSINYYTVEAGRRPLPLRQPTGTDRVDLEAASQEVDLPDTGTVEKALTFAEARLFAPAAARVQDGPLPNGRRSNVARMAYRRDLSAPPRAGTLFDGLAVADAVDATVTPQPPVAAAEPELRAPRVLGYLAGGSGVAVRRSGTTVADGSLKRRTAPTIASVHGRLGRRLPVSLDVADVPGAKVGRTLTPAALPFTATVGTARSYGLGSGPATDRVAGLSGLGGAVPKGTAAAKAAGVTRKARTPQPPTLASGDVVVLHCPDHAADVGTRRPTLDLGGTARVVCLRGDGTVLLDDVRTDAVPVPAGSELVLVQADGTLDDPDGLEGWHTRSRVAAVGFGTAVGPGCVLDVEAGTTDRQVTWTTAGEVVRGAGAATTRFSRPVTALAIVIESDDPERVGELGLELTGATRATDATGAPAEPVLLMNGDQSTAVYPVVPDGGDDPVAVRVVAGAGWRVTGVLGSTDGVDEVAAGIRRYGVAAAAARMLAAAGPGCAPAWRPASKPSRGGGGGRGRR